MLTNEEIKTFLKDTEADNVERTVSTNKTDKFCEAICAFANDMPGHGTPGYLFIGADDKTGEITGAEITDQLLQNLAGHRDSGQNWLPGAYIQYVRFKGGGLESDIIAEAMKNLAYVNRFGRRNRGTGYWQPTWTHRPTFRVCFWMMSGWKSYGRRK